MISARVKPSNVPWISLNLQYLKFCNMSGELESMVIASSKTMLSNKALAIASPSLIFSFLASYNKSPGLRSMTSPSFNVFKSLDNEFKVEPPLISAASTFGVEASTSNKSLNKISPK